MDEKKEMEIGRELHVKILGEGVLIKPKQKANIDTSQMEVYALCAEKIFNGSVGFIRARDPHIS